MITLIWKITKYTLMLAVVAGVVITALELLSSYEPGTTIHDNAPVKTNRSIVIHASAEKIWEVFTDVNGWPSWQKDITQASIDAPFATGSVITWETNGFTINSQLQTVKPYSIVGWAGEAFGSFAIHLWKFTEKNGYTSVTVEESMEGWLVWLTQRYLQPGLHTSTDRWLNALKQASENRP